MINKSQLDFFILNMMNDQKLIEEIADELCKYFPDRFRDRKKALSYVRELSLKYSQ